jgi:very-short-patch-repair endonuclease
LGRTYAKRSKGEILVYNWLLENKIKFKQEYLIKFPYVVKKKPFVFIDFYLPKHNIFIEYNGKQHYEYVPYFHKTIEDFELQKFRDEVVRNYCVDKGIKLIEIP